MPRRPLPAASACPEILVRLRRLPGGGVVVTLPAVPGWSARAHGGPDALASALGSAWAEADIAAYARSKGTHHDLLLHDAETTASQKGKRVDYDPDRADRARPGRRAARVLAAVPEPVPGAASSTPPTAAERDALDRALAWRFDSLGIGHSPAGRRFQPGTWQVRTTLSVLARYGRTPVPLEAE